MPTASSPNLAASGPARGREQMALVIIGHVDHGKSTVIGRLLADTGSLPEGKLEQVRAMCDRNARPFEYAFLLDALKTEQAQGITIDTARCFFKTARRDYIINDAPGHIEFLKNMVTGAGRAEAALLVIDAHEGILENSKRHGYIASMLGVRQLAVLVNKMDLVGFSPDRFEQIRRDYSAFLQPIGVHPLAFIPIAARDGLNIAERTPAMPWFKGPTVLEQVDRFSKPEGRAGAPFRMPVQDIYKFTEAGDDRRIVAGTIDAGTVRVGDEVVFWPSGKKSVVRSIEGFHTEPRTQAEAGWAAGLTLTTQIYIKPGELMCRKHDLQPLVRSRFRANLFWMGRQPMVRKQRYKLKLGATRVPAELTAIRQVLDASELSAIQGKDQIERHDVAECVIETLRPVAFDLRSDIEETGRFVIVDDYEIAGCGIILEALDDQAGALQAQRSERRFQGEPGLVAPADREQRQRHRSRFIALTGAMGTGRHDLAMRLERALFDRGIHTYYMGMRNLFRDLDEAQRVRSTARDEHIESLGELAGIMTQAGLIFITTLTDVDDYDMEKLRGLAAPGELFSIHLGDNPFETFQPDLLFPVQPDLAATVSDVVRALADRKILLD